MRKFQKFIFALFRLVIRLHRRRRAAENKRTRVVSCAEPRNFHGVVTGISFRNVTSVVLLVDDYDAEVFKGCEYRRPCADGNRRFAASEPAPFVKPFALRQSAVQYRDFVAESFLKLQKDLRRQRDFGHEHYRGFVFR